MFESLDSVLGENSEQYLDEILDDSMSKPVPEPFIPAAFSIPTEDYQEESIEMPESIKDLKNNPRFVQEMNERITAVDQYSWARGELGGLDFGFESLNKAFEGLNTGITLVAGVSNIGKSGFLLKLGWSIMNANKVITEKTPYKAFVIYFSLDDSNNELMPRIVSIDQRIKINAVRSPKKYQENKTIMEKREQGFKNLRDSALGIAMLDLNDGTSIEYIEETIKRYKDELEVVDPGAYKIVVIIDNFYDITIDAKGYAEENARIEFLATELTNISVKYDSPVICSAEFRKINSFKRPQRDDIKSSGKLAYEAKAILLCHSDVGVKQDQASVYWELQEGTELRKMPVYEVQIDKNKFSAAKNKLFFRFTPEFSDFEEAGEDESRRYMTMISSS